jgi:asparagine synthetase B (glutamine-hydrolysing)
MMTAEQKAAAERDRRAAEFAALESKYEKVRKELVEAHFELALSDAASLPRGNALMQTLNLLLDEGREREHALLTVAWRPLWRQLQATFASHQHESARGAAGLAKARLQAGLSIRTDVTRAELEEATAQLSVTRARRPFSFPSMLRLMYTNSERWSIWRARSISSAFPCGRGWDCALVDRLPRRSSSPAMRTKS